LISLHAIASVPRCAAPLGDWLRVERQLREGGGNDAALTAALNHIGRHYAERLKWAKAALYYSQARNSGELARCLYALEDYPGLGRLADALAEGDALLLDIAAKLASVGLCAEAVSAYLKAGHHAATCMRAAVFALQLMGVSEGRAANLVQGSEPFLFMNCLVPFSSSPPPGCAIHRTLYE
jgi:hypothetical protein